MHGERIEDAFVFGGERAGALVEYLEYPHDPPVPVFHRHAEYRPGPIACDSVDVGVEPRVEIGIGDVQRVTGCRHVTGDPAPRGHPDLYSFPPLEHARPEFFLLFVQEVDCPPVTVHEPQRGLQDDAEEFVQVERRVQNLGGLNEQFEAADLLLGHPGVAFHLGQELAVDSPEPHAEHLEEPERQGAVLTEELFECRTPYGADDAFVDCLHLSGARPSVNERELPEEIPRVQEGKGRLVSEPVPFGDPHASAGDEIQRIPLGLVFEYDLPRAEPAFCESGADRLELLVGKHFGQNVVAKPFDVLR